MEFKKLLQIRRACHAFLPNKTISPKVIEEIIEETSLTPSGYNAQPWAFIVIQEKENLAKIKKIAYDQKHLENVSTFIIVLGDLEIGRNVEKILSDWLKYDYCTEDEIPAYRNSIAKNRPREKKELMAIRNAMLAAMTLIYSAENRGIATCPMMGFSHSEMEKTLNIPDDHTIALMIAMGYRDEEKEKARLPRKLVSELIHWEKFNEAKN